MSETEASSLTQNEHTPLLRVLEKRELLSQVLEFVGEGTEIAPMFACKSVCKFVRLLRGWQEEKKEEGNEPKIVCGMSVSQVSAFLSSVGLAKWGVDVLGLPTTKRTTELAVKGGHRDTLAWLLSRGVPLERNIGRGDPQNACRLAAEAGHLSVLQYLRSLEPPCPWDEFTCAGASLNGHLHVLQWARSQPEPTLG